MLRMTAMHRMMMGPFLLLVSVSALAEVNLNALEFKHGIAFYHELKYPVGFTHLEHLNPDAPKGGKLVLPSASNFDTFAPAAERGTGAPNGWLANDRLIRRGGDELSGFYSELADGIAITDDRLAIVFRVHPRAKWRDGVPITSRDVAYTLRVRIAQTWGRVLFGFIDSVEEIDDRHLAIHLKVPVQLSDFMVFRTVAIMPEHYWRDKDPSASTLVPPLNSGPYEITAFKQGRYVEYRRDPDYWGKDIPLNRGRYNFDTIRFDIYRDATVTREAFRKGLIDIWTESDARYWHGAFDTPAYHKGWVKKIRQNQGFAVGIRQGIVLNNRLGKFADRRVRQALTLAVDFEWQNKVLHFGFHKRAHSYWPDTILTATGLPSADELALLSPYREQLPAELFSTPFRFPEVVTEEDYRANMVRARELLDEAGWRVVDGVLRNAAGEAFEIAFLSRNPADTRTLLPYFQRLEQLGIRGTLVLVDGDSQWVHRLRQFDFDALLAETLNPMPPHLALPVRFHSDGGLGSGNGSGISDPVVDFLVDEAISATTLSQMIATHRALDRVLLWQYYQIPLYAIDRPATVYWDKFGRPDYEPKYQPAGLEGWWYDTEKAARIIGGGD